jgi:hypothetical protein
LGLRFFDLYLLHYLIYRLLRLIGGVRLCVDRLSFHSRPPLFASAIGLSHLQTIRTLSQWTLCAALYSLMSSFLQLGWL